MLDERLYWAISVLGLLSLPGDRAPLSAWAIGRALQAPDNGLRTVLTSLTRAGLLTAEAGRDGRVYRPAREVPDGLTVADVYRALAGSPEWGGGGQGATRREAESVLLAGLASLPLADLLAETGFLPVTGPHSGAPEGDRRTLH